MRIIIVEDEILAVERLSDLILQYDSNIKIIESLDSVESTVEWFKNNEAPDLAFFDIQLADGLSFEIFEQTNVKCPIIFTTAFDEYALRAFKVNSVDYILKPIDNKELIQAFQKFDRTQQQSPPTPQIDLIRQAMEMIQSPQKNYKSRFIVKSGNHISAIEIPEIAYFFSEHKMSWIKTFSGKKYMVDYKMEALESITDPLNFFRLNRKYISSFKAIQDVVSYSNSRLKIKLLDMPADEEILISREKVQDFKKWLDQ